MRKPRCPACTGEGELTLPLENFRGHLLCAHCIKDWLGIEKRKGVLVEWRDFLWPAGRPKGQGRPVKKESVYALLQEGKTPAEIVRQLHVSRTTVCRRKQEMEERSANREIQS